MTSNLAERFQTPHEIVKAAKHNLAPGPWDYLMGGAETETTLRRNRQALDSLACRPRVLRDVRGVDVTSTVTTVGRGDEVGRIEVFTSNTWLRRVKMLLMNDMRPLDEMFADPDPLAAEKDPDLMDQVFNRLHRSGFMPEDVRGPDLATKYVAWLARQEPSSNA